jgi:predicted 2-oxoglutarate/Fe(II)-dependent dioxygenase YbiX
VLGTVPLVDPQRHIGEIERFLAKLPQASAGREGGHSAPVLIVPRVFEPELCRDLIFHCSSRQGEDSGFMSTDPGTGNTIFKRDHNFKRRTDFALEDETLRLAIHGKVLRRLLPEIDKAFQFHVTRIERYLIARYDAREGGYFRPHRDNGTRATAHRRFAVTVNLNAEDYDGGDLRFPEFDTMTFRAPTGGAAIFSCSLMHEVVPVTRGTRYCFLPFLYDEVSAKVREDNLKYLTSAEKREINI